jgi:hypothetical protein
MEWSGSEEFEMDNVFTPMAEMHGEVLDILDQVAVRGVSSVENTRKLRELPAAWTLAGGDSARAALLRKAQGVVGMINVSKERDPIREECFRDLIELKQAWRILLSSEYGCGRRTLC